MAWPLGSVTVLAVDEPTAETTNKTPTVPARTAELIERLGDDSFFVRERAQQELAAMGFKAFDALMVAEHHADIEVVARARYLLRLLDVQWINDSDPEKVRKLLSDFDQIDGPVRRDRMRALAALPEDQGLEALCRLARFQRDELLSKWAAMFVIEQDSGREQWAQVPTGQPADETAAWALSQVEQPPRSSLEVIDVQRWAHRQGVIQEAISSSPRPAARWLRAYANIRTAPEAPMQTWNELVESEAKVLARTPRQSEPTIITRMLLQQSAWLRTLDHREAADAAMLRILDFVGSDTKSLRELVMWVVRGEAWPTLDALETQFSAVIAANPLLGYTVAYARRKQGQTERAEQLAAQARAFRPGDYKEHFTVAGAMQVLGWIDWTEGECQTIIDHKPRNAQSVNYVLVVQSWLAELLHDRGDDLEASEIMDRTNTMFEELAKKNGQQQDRPLSPRRAQARRDLFLGLHLAKQGSFDDARDHLYQALKYDETDADVLIALFELPNLDDKQRGELKSQIDETCELFRDQIRQDPNNPTPYNQLAWLAANTEGDLDEALQASLRSLKVDIEHPNHPGRLDTLARCYYARGEYEKAVEIQTKAVQLEPHTGLMSRQLAVFLKKLDETKPAATP